MDQSRETKVRLVWLGVCEVDERGGWVEWMIEWTRGVQWADWLAGCMGERGLVVYDLDERAVGIYKEGIRGLGGVEVKC